VPTVAVLVGYDDGVIWGYATSERHRRMCRRAGVSSVVEQADLPGSGRVLVLRRDFILDENLLVALLASDGAVVVAADAAGVLRPVAAHVGAADAAAIARVIEHGSLEGAALPSGLRIGRPEEIGPSFNRKLRKRAQPYALQITPATRYDAEWRTFTEAYKGATDFVTKFLWPVPAFHVTRWCAARRLTPNMVTTLGALLTLLATWLFWSSHVMLGLIPAWAMTFFDTVDGKLARCTLTSSRWGNVYDHGIDLLHPPFWWIAWWHGVQQVDASVSAPLMDISVVVILVGYVVLRLQEAAFKSFFGIQTHIWRPIDYVFRAITSRRNPNLAILTVSGLLGEPAWGFVLVAIWTVFSVIFHFVRIAQAALVRSRGERISSWLTEPLPSGLQG
jgi:phosphatidylglycerophosphate synthase